MNSRVLSFSQRILSTMLLLGGTLLSAQELPADAATAKTPITIPAFCEGGIPRRPPHQPPL